MNKVEQIREHYEQYRAIIEAYRNTLLGISARAMDEPAGSDPNGKLLSVIEQVVAIEDDYKQHGATWNSKSFAYVKTLLELVDDLEAEVERLRHDTH